MSSQRSLCWIHDNCVSKLFQEGKGGTVCDEVTHQTAISHKASLKLLSQDISFFTLGPNGFSNITLQIPRKECYQTASWSLSYKSVRWTHRLEKSFSESFFHVLIWWNFLCQDRPQCDPRKPFSGSSKTVLMDCSTKLKCNSVRWIPTSPRSLEKASFLFSSVDIPLSP